MPQKIIWKNEIMINFYFMQKKILQIDTTIHRFFNERNPQSYIL